MYIPMLLIYPKGSTTGEKMAIVLKKSLSKCLTRYYPFAGRFPSLSSPYVDCNDEGVLFLEARTDTQLADTFNRMNTNCQDDETDQLFPDDMINYKNTTSTDLVAVQLTHFACGGSALAVSFSHAIGDGRTLSSFLQHWVSVARYGSTDHIQVLPLNPHFIQSPLTQRPEMGPTPIEHVNVVMKKFVFPNSRLSELKKKIAAGSVNNPTRFEVLTSLVYKTMVAAATARSGCFKPSYLIIMVNVRDKLVPKLPQSTVGNLVKVMMAKTMHESQTSLSLVAAEIRKEKQLLDGIKTMQDSIESTKSVIEQIKNGKFENIHKGKYHVSSACGFGLNKLDFGWGKPMGTFVEFKSINANTVVLMDTIDDDGIEPYIKAPQQLLVNQAPNCRDTQSSV
ncbi:hypothetical protein E3N88_41298 [Mikania micrantha]|uniref:Transferase, Chloramphenicol acetyltransferase-like domain protein n=1 Tax=Mikania micrantha TaxID=192012 RepID=A0A5N6LR03_9ASTR|nr:hypothetical protein E3N88_41298 [Mikania micrantha]